jgi:predicted nucleotidyltransferase
MSNEIHIKNVKQILAKDDIDLVALFRFGSQVYGTTTSKSDLDFVSVILDEDGNKRKEMNVDTESMPGGERRNGDSDDRFIYSESIGGLNYDIHIRTCTEFQSLLDAQNVPTIEAYFSPVIIEGETIMNPKFSYALDKTKLRSTVSGKASLAHVKAKKKILVERDRDFYIAKKSLFHAIRLYYFGCQLGSTGTIADFVCCRDLFLEIMGLEFPNETEINDEEADVLWKKLDEKFTPIYKKKRSEFIAICPKIGKQQSRND